MQVVYAREPFPDSFSKSIFLAGPTPRTADVKSWRPDALRLLEELGYEGAVFIPEDRDNAPKFDYTDQINWEERGLNMADAIVFWIPRNLETLPGFTTNIEWGAWCESRKVVLGAPKDAPKMAYLKHYAEKYRVPSETSLENTLSSAIKLIGDEAERAGGEREIPIWIWRRPAFQQWYRAQVAAGHRLDGARVRWQFSSRYSGRPFCWVLQPKVFIPNEDRHKTNEVIITRPDISAVLAFHRRETIERCSVVLVREFRSSANSHDGFVHELPGGSSIDETAPLTVAADELREETGMSFPSERFVFHQQRQCVATMLTHQAALLSIELTESELDQFKERIGERFGDSDSERTYVEVRTVDEILNSTDVDWTHVGMILSVLNATS